jgi:hypothetical protein
VVSYPVQEFDRLWALASTSKVRSGHVAFTAPYRNRSIVVTLGFSTSETPEDQ